MLPCSRVCVTRLASAELTDTSSVPARHRACAVARELCPSRAHVGRVTVNDADSHEALDGMREFESVLCTLSFYLSCGRPFRPHFFLSSVRELRGLFVGEPMLFSVQ